MGQRDDGSLTTPKILNAICLLLDSATSTAMIQLGLTVLMVAFRSFDGLRGFDARSDWRQQVAVAIGDKVGDGLHADVPVLSGFLEHRLDEQDNQLIFHSH